MRVRVIAKPPEEHVDGIRLDHLEPDTVREVSASVGAWLIAQGYAQAEMRRLPSTGVPGPAATGHDQGMPRRRSTDR